MVNLLPPKLRWATGSPRSRASARQARRARGGWPATRKGIWPLRSLVSPHRRRSSAHTSLPTDNLPGLALDRSPRIGRSAERRGGGRRTGPTATRRRHRTPTYCSSRPRLTGERPMTYLVDGSNARSGGALIPSPLILRHDRIHHLSTWRFRHDVGALHGTICQIAEKNASSAVWERATSAHGRCRLARRTTSAARTMPAAGEYNPLMMANPASKTGFPPPLLVRPPRLAVTAPAPLRVVAHDSAIIARATRKSVERLTNASTTAAARRSAPSPCGRARGAAIALALPSPRRDCLAARVEHAREPSLSA